MSKPTRISLYRGHTVVEYDTGIALLYAGDVLTPPPPENLLEDYPSVHWARAAAEERNSRGVR